MKLSSIECFLSSRRTCQRMGRFTTGTSGFGLVEVSGLSREPSPPAMTTACILVSARRILFGETTDEYELWLSAEPLQIVEPRLELLLEQINRRGQDRIYLPQNRGEICSVIQRI